MLEGRGPPEEQKKAPEESGMTGPESDKNITRRDLLAGGISLAFGESLSKFLPRDIFRLNDSSDRVWGPDSAPSYPILRRIDYLGEPMLFREYLRSIAFNTHSKIEGALADQNAHSVYQRAINSALRPNDPIEISTTEQLAKDNFVAATQDPEIAARNIFSVLTGKAVPNNVQVITSDEEVNARCNIPGVSIDQIAGCVLPGLNRIFTRDVKFLKRVVILLHELGHKASVMTNQDAPALSASTAEEYSTQINVRKEAAAFVFQMAGVRTLIDGDLRAACYLENVGAVRHVARYYFGEFDRRAHPEGAAVADAALTVFSDPSEAMEHISSTEPLDAAIVETIETNKRLAKSLVSLEARIRPLNLK